MTLEPNQLAALDLAVSRRLARLAGMPLDTARLERRLEKAMDAYDQGRTDFRLPLWFRSTSAVAALILMAVFIGLLTFTTTTPVIASPNALARVHHEVVAGTDGMVPVATLEEANAVVAQRLRQAPALPRQMDAAVRSSCLHDIQGVLAACVLVEYKGQPVTLVVADGNDLCSRDGTMVMRGHRQLMVHTVDGVRMAMVEIDNRWLCVMGDLPTDDLVDLAASIEF